MEKTIKTKKLTNYYLFTIFIILFLGLAVNNIVYTEAASCAGNWINPHWACSGTKCQKFSTCGYNSCSSDYSCGTPVPTTTTTTTTTTKPSTTTTTTGAGGSCECIKTSSGAWTCWDKINNKCCSSCGTCPPQWSCSSSPLGCYESSGGYVYKSTCESNCYYGYSCYPGFVCRYGWLGTYKTLSGCEACCSASSCNATTYYSCNPDPSNPHCIVDSKGSYSSWSYCESNCKSSGGGTTTTTTGGSTTTTTKPSTTTTTTTTTSPPPPPKCQIFEFSINGKTNVDRDPLLVWVNASLKGYISINDSCTECTVTSDDVWGNPPKDYTITSLSTYINETFKIPTSGTYFFTLSCIGNPADPDDSDEDTTSLKAVEALNLPWWREIIPVLPGDS